MRYGIMLKAVGLALAWAWTSTAMAQSGTPLAQRTLEGRVVSVDPQDRSITVDWKLRATGDRLARAGAPVAPRRHGRAARPTAPPPDQRTAAAVPTDPASTTKLSVAPRATVVRNGLNVRADEVRPGDEVRASFLGDDLTRTHPWQLEVRSPHGREAPWGSGS